jgi:hypothetical protein
MAEKKKFALQGNQIKRLAPGLGYCIATDMIMVDGCKVGIMFRQEPHEPGDSGWVFLAGRESQEYMDDAAKMGVYDVNTVANYDPEIIPYLGAPAGSEFERENGAGTLVQTCGQPWETTSAPTAPAKVWPPPGFPVVEGSYQLTTTWSIQLSQPFARRSEDGSLVLWRPGLTIWLAVWGNDRNESAAARIAAVKETAAPHRYAEREERTERLTRYSYRLRDQNDDGPVESLNAVVLNEREHVQMSVYFDDPADEAKAHQLVDSVTDAPHAAGAQ